MTAWQVLLYLVGWLVYNAGVIVAIGAGVGMLLTLIHHLRRVR